MGVPAFFRWLSKKYVSVIATCVEEKGRQVDGTTIPVDATKPNPNGVEFDNLYLDMNGIIHPCTHPEDKPAPKDEDEMMIAIFECIDRLFNIVRPRKLLYMAIDGVAPRAKMNQQRSRRFRASKETVEKVQEISRIRSELAAKGCHLPPEKPKENHFDSNCITPGTPFMARLSACLHYYVHDRMNNNPAWKGIKVILSDANVPGEGEHKIMDYIRRQRGQPDYDPNIQHCLCGADADLIMLGLATHEPNFTIIREEFKPNKPKPCDICGQMGHEMKDCIGLPKEQANQDVVAFGSEVEFIFVRLNVLREYLQKELEMPNLPFEYNFERAVDDWVFMCFFVGNDFLPHLPSLEIREGAINRLVELYKKTVYKTGGFLTDSGNVNLDRVQLIMQDLGSVEDEIFKKRQQSELAFRAREKAKKRRTKMFQNWKPQWTPVGQFAPQAVGSGPVAPIQNARQEAFQMRMQGMHTRAGFGSAESQEDGGRGVKRKSDQMDQNGNQSDDEDNEPPDEVRLWEDGFKDRYYESKFDVDAKNMEFRLKVAHEYVRGLCWVLRYYYQGCASWKWYFPYHYAPFASDFINIGVLSTEFEKGTKPFRPLEQLMGVFPAASSSHVPPAWAPLMSDPDSPIIDFYPEDFKIDLNGKKFAWQGVALLPFVDEKRLFKALEPYYSQLTDAEVRRNVRGDDRLYMAPKNTGYKFVSGLYENRVNGEVDISVDGIFGQVLLANDCVSMGGKLNSPVRGLLGVTENSVVTISFRDPKYPDSYVFPATRLPGAVEPPRVLKPGDLNVQENRNWRPQLGMAPATQRASLGEAGHRMLGHQGVGRGNAGAGIYSAVPPMMSYDHRGNRNSWPSSRNDNRDNRDNQNNSRSGGGGGGGGYGGYSSGYNSGYNSGRNSGGGGGGGGGGGHWRSSSGSGSNSNSNTSSSYGYSSVTGPSGYYSSSQSYQSSYSSGQGQGHGQGRGQGGGGGGGGQQRYGSSRGGGRDGGRDGANSRYGGNNGRYDDSGRYRARSGQSRFNPY